MIEKNYLLNLGFVCDNEFLNMYVDLINRNQNTLKEKYVTQKHHIVPRYYYKSQNEPIDDSETNIVNLKVKDHILAHYYLTRCSTEQFYGYNFGSIYYILNNFSIQNKQDLELFVSKLENYDELYKQYRELIANSQRNPITSKKKHDSILLYINDMKENHSSEWEERNRNISNKLKGKKLSDSHKEKLSIIATQRVGDKNSFYNHKHTEETKKQIGNKNSKSVIMIKDNEEIVFKSINSCIDYLKSIGIVSTIRPIKRAIKNNEPIYGAYWKIIDNGHKEHLFSQESKQKLIDTASKRGYLVQLVDKNQILDFTSLNKAAQYILDNNLDNIHIKNIVAKIQKAAKNNTLQYGFKWNVFKV